MLPNLLIVGAQKCGTSALHAYLDLHPQIGMSRRKELDFLLADGDPAWYAAQFPDAPVRGDASPNYSAWPHWTGVPERAAALVPDARIVYLVRDPFDRMLSHYVHGRAMGYVTRPLEELVADPESAAETFVWRSRYATQLERWLTRFPAERVLVVEQGELLEQRADTLRRLYRFLGVDETFEHEATGQEHYRGEDRREPAGALGRRARALRTAGAARLVPGPVRRALGQRLSRPVERPQLDPATRAHLEPLLRAEADRLRSLTGRDFPGWSV